MVLFFSKSYSLVLEYCQLECFGNIHGLDKKVLCFVGLFFLSEHFSKRL